MSYELGFNIEDYMLGKNKGVQPDAWRSYETPSEMVYHTRYLAGNNPFQKFPTARFLLEVFNYYLLDVMDGDLPMLAGFCAYVPMTGRDWEYVCENYPDETEIILNKLEELAINNKGVKTNILKLYIENKIKGYTNSETGINVNNETVIDFSKLSEDELRELL